MQRLNYLDALRGLAILGVVATHAALSTPDAAAPLLALATYGARGVQLFYMVSAFTLLTVYRDRLAPRSFFVRRFFRIAPAFYAAILLFLLLNGVGPRYYAPEGIGARHLAMTFTFLHGWMPDTTNAIVPGGWSIACEAMFYLAFPLLRAHITSLPRALIGFAIAMLVSLPIYLIPYVVPGLSLLFRDFLFFSIFVQAPAFLAGFVVYYLPRDRIARAAPWAALAALTALIGLALGGARLGIFYLALPPFALLLWAMASRPVPLLDSAPMRALGTVSFSLYLFHRPVLKLLDPWFAGSALIPLFCTALPLATLLAAASWYAIEQPGIRLGRTLLRRSGSAKSSGW